ELAMSAIRLFHGEVSEDLLMKEKPFEGLRTKLLRGAADFYDKLESLLRHQNDPKSREALGRSYYELADLTGKIGRVPEALNVHEKGLAVWRALAEGGRAGATTEAEQQAAQLEVARSLLAVGRWRRETGDLKGAMESYEESRKVAEALGAKAGQSVAVRDA